ncbi:MAG: hypothetical protein J7J51_00155 [Candidatus Omnitrophica bacterium]|nr:hypothetical protein [Candidatus Omnitrophota bacterium]
MKKGLFLISLFSVICFLASIISGCATFQDRVTPIRPPSDYYTRTDVGGVVIAAEVLSTPEQSRAQFNVDLGKIGILPIKLIVKNNSEQTVQIDRSQIFGVRNDGSMYNAYALHQSVERIRASETTKGAVKGAGTGAVVGAVAGATLGAVSGGDSREVGRMAGVGAAMGTFMGAALGGDSIASYIPEKMHYLDWGRRTIRPGYLISGFIFLPRADYVELRLAILNTAEDKVSEAVIRLR